MLSDRFDRAPDGSDGATLLGVSSSMQLTG